MMHTIAFRTLIVWLWFGAVSAIAGGFLGVFANGAGVPLAYLHHTPFSSYFVPGLLLGIVIGGTQLTAAILLHRHQRYGLTAAVIAGFGMVVWIFVELAVISEYSPLQAIYLAVGVGEVVFVLLVLGLRTPIRTPLEIHVPESATGPRISEER